MVELRVYLNSAMAEIPTGFYYGIIAVISIIIILLIRYKDIKKRLRYSALVLLVGWICLVFGTAVVFRETHAERGYSLIPFISYWEYGEKSYFMERFAINLLNVALFVPVGFLVGCGFRNISWKRVLQIAFFLSLSIEILQFIFKKGYSEVDDIIHNVVGCLIGYGICSLLTKTTTILTKTKTKTKTGLAQ